MLLVNALKTVCDFLIYFSFVCLIPSFGKARILMGTVMALAFLSSIILQKVKDSLPARILCGLLPALGLFTAKSISEIVFTSVILIFYLVLTIDGRNDIYYEDYKYWFGISAVPALVMFVICFTSWPVRPETTVLSGFYLFFGVLVLRRKRAGAGAGVKLRLVNAAELVGVVGIGTLVPALIHTVLSHAEGFFEKALLPIAYIFYGIINFVTWICNHIMEDEMEEATEEASAEVSEILQDLTLQEDAIPEPVDVSGYNMVENIIKIIVVLMILVVLTLIMHSIRKVILNMRLEKATNAQEIEEGEVDSFSFFGKGRKKKKRTLRISNNEKIRQIYKEYLFLVNLYVVDIVRQTTSEDVLEASEGKTDIGKAAQLRELYIKARYHDAKEMSADEVEHARNLLADIRQEIEENRNALRAK
ncbi:MAG: hypothetical protein K6F75_11185 [Butyrivibrio sp.]|nr:hypothetical protein [Butyrivibrio sp.]